MLGTPGQDFYYEEVYLIRFDEFREKIYIEYRQFNIETEE
jgi:hypothetical protein